jgi:thiol-disulfide isomerase/thioredoxin
MPRNTIVCIIIFIIIAVAAESTFADAPAIGKPAPDFTVTLAGPLGRRQKLSDYRGKPVALHFWATWCGPCVRELPLIAELTASKADVLTVIAVNCQEPENVAASFLSRQKLRLNMALDTNGAISMLYNINAIPQTFMIDRDGVIRSIQVGSYTKRSLDAAVSALLSSRQ